MSTSSGAAFSRSDTRVLRDKGIDQRIKCTSTLVANYNAEEDANVRKAMRTWLDTLINEFSNISPGSIPKKTITEFMNLAEIKVRGSSDEELVRRVYTTIRHVVTQERKNCQVYYVLALEYILSTVGSDILQEDARSLMSLAYCLIEMTDPQNGPLIRATFKYNVSCLHALERVLMVLHDLDKNSPEQYTLKFFEDKVKKHLSKIISCQHYYPFAYQAFLIKENIKTLLEKDTKSLLINAGRRAFYAFCGGLYIFQAFRELAVMKLDFSAMESGIGNFREAFKEIGWDVTSSIQEIVLAASETTELDDFGIFQQCYNEYKKASWVERMKWKKQKMIRYVIVSHLCLFCREKQSGSIQEPAFDLLVKLVNEDEGKQWREDDQIFEAMIDALLAIEKENEEYKQRVINAFNRMGSFPSDRRKKIIEGCLEGRSFEERTESEYQSEEDATSYSLFKTTKQKLGLRNTPFKNNQNQQTLKQYYKTDSFAKVSLFANERDQRHINTFDFNLKQYEKVVVSHDHANHSSKDNYNQREHNLQRTMMVRKPITVQDLFKTCGTSAHGFQEDAKRVLVIGNPGTGKTCLSKRLCYDWGNNAWGVEFTHVYLLPVRRLSDNRIGNCGDLSFTIVQLIYHAQVTQELNKTLYEEVFDNLSETSTLLILDGYDEAGDTAKDMVASALTLGCCLLILSRPHSVNDIRPKVDIEVESLEFSDRQLEAFVLKELESTDGNDLIELLSSNYSIRNTCRVAVNAQIVTKLWRMTSSRAELTESNCANLCRLYSLMVNYVWKRFIEKTEDKFNRDSMYHSLECIAFKSFKKNLVEIPEHIVLDYAQETEKVFRDSGFLLFMEEGSVFQFAHLTFHEYFAGCHLAKLLKSIDDEEKQEAVDFIIEHRYIATSRVMLSFTTQQFCMRKDIRKTLEAFKDLMQVLESEPVPTISLQYLLLRMRTLDAFLPCGLDETEVHTNDDVMLIVNDATDALKHWFGYELDGDDRGSSFLMKEGDLRIAIVDELERMPSLFNRFPDLLKPILLNDCAKSKWGYESHFDIARIGKLNPQYARQCIVPLIDNWTTEEQAHMIRLCTLIGPMCAEPALDHLTNLLEVQDSDILDMATTSLVKCLQLFPKKENIRQLVVKILRHFKSHVRHIFVRELGFTTFTPEDEVGTYVWDLLNEAMKDDNNMVRGAALKSCVRLYQTCAKSLDEVMEFIREFLASLEAYDRVTAMLAIEDITQKAPEKEEELLALMKALCRDFDGYARYSAVKSLLIIIERSCLKREVLFNVAFDVFKDGDLDVQLKLLPFLFSFDKKEDGIDEVNEWIANFQDLDEDVRRKANSCREANALLSDYTIEEIHKKFYDQDEEVQMEVVRQIYLKEIEINKAASAIAEMAVLCLQYDKNFEPSKSLLDKLSKTELFPSVVLKKLVRIGRYPHWNYVQKQPLSHLLEYYWSAEDSDMIRFIAERLLLSAVIFEKKGETEMEVTFREKGANVKQTAPVEVVEELLSRCNAHLKIEYGLDFLHDDAF